MGTGAVARFSPISSEEKRLSGFVECRATPTSTKERLCPCPWALPRMYADVTTRTEYRRLLEFLLPPSLYFSTLRGVLFDFILNPSFVNLLR